MPSDCGIGGDMRRAVSFCSHGCDSFPKGLCMHWSLLQHYPQRYLLCITTCTVNTRELLKNILQIASALKLTQTSLATVSEGHTAGYHCPSLYLLLYQETQCNIV